ncbi:hypothetical protein K431DRAFT_292622 [Polychaeton citri CBS 116435]|uniref:Uncharacterized protein n=1 Tax=Polychaeton citri CBS 116435 TaxID=1314669 RepID=A0A9P4Q9R2_9PEZI|nr:hypothetical protein K431DRAFT_292622 [Polychaeton citri CBS 116435]
MSTLGKHLSPQGSPASHRSSVGSRSNGLPSLNINLRQHKTAIALHWLPIVLTSGLLPIIGYFALEYGTNLELNVVLAPWLALMGAASLFSLSSRTWRLVKKDSNCQPLGQTNTWGLDYFDWNFVVGFIALTILITIGITVHVLRVVAIAHAVLLILVTPQLIIVAAATMLGIRAPFRFSSVEKGERLRGACYVIVEDIVAVDGGQGKAFRQAWSDRYEASPALRSHMLQMDLMWGTSGVILAVIIFAIAFGVSNADVGYTLGFALPWVWAGTMAYVTTKLSQRMLARERAMDAQHLVA